MDSLSERCPDLPPAFRLAGNPVVLYRTTPTGDVEREYQIAAGYNPDSDTVELFIAWGRWGGILRGKRTWSINAFQGYWSSTERYIIPGFLRAGLEELIQQQTKRGYHCAKDSKSVKEIDEVRLGTKLMKEIGKVHRETQANRWGLLNSDVFPVSF